MGIFQSSCIFMYAVVLLFCFYVYIVLHHHIGCRHVTLCRCVYWHCLVYMLPSCYFDWIHVVHRLVSLHMLAQCHVVLMCILMIYVHKSHLGQQENQGHVSSSISSRATLVVLQDNILYCGHLSSLLFVTNKTSVVFGHTNTPLWLAHDVLICNLGHGMNIAVILLAGS